MLSRLWGSVKRHPYKVLAGAAAAAAVAAAGAVAAKIYKHHKRLAALLDADDGELSQLLLKELGLSEGELTQLRQQQQEQQQQQQVTEAEWVAAFHFVRNQCVSDVSLLLLLREVQRQQQQQLEAAFPVDAYTRVLREPQQCSRMTPQQKEVCFRELCANVVARTVSCTVLLLLLLLLHRVQVNILAAALLQKEQQQQNEQQQQEEQQRQHEQNFVFLSSTRRAASAAVISRIAAAALSEVCAFVSVFPPQKAITAELLQQQLQQIMCRMCSRLCREATQQQWRQQQQQAIRRQQMHSSPPGFEDIDISKNAAAAAAASASAAVAAEAAAAAAAASAVGAGDFVEDEYGYAALLLPEEESLDSNDLAALPPAAAGQVLLLLQEARDVLDSPAFAAAVKGLCAAAAACLVQRIVESLQEAGTLPPAPAVPAAAAASPAAAAAAATAADPRKTPFQLARCLGCTCKLAEWALGVGSEGQLLHLLSGATETVELSALCYWAPHCDFARVQQLLHLVALAQQHEQQQQLGLKGPNLQALQGTNQLQQQKMQQQHTDLAYGAAQVM
ncbi:hypothetical protein, conserved [Eimeria necatrix]|uniref:Uncharacterized protein n=1 Tax=Eimeria necatrix TaxID=51315 RepID=U6MSS8_9EIME|nr:hypothetical protein, conserved [Eimeria necatrix]CDJ66143.1 hypothetical protein, conserved [Eimeria necatrix]